MVVDLFINALMGLWDFILGRFPEPDPGTFQGVQVDNVLQILGDINSLIPVWPALLLVQVLVLFIVPFLIIRTILFVRYVLLP